jgi:1-piperideine-2-carboxylate/1-pyrroline-2-carboxylate reductase [NAD(P)H]
VEWAPAVCQWLAADGLLVVDTREADHEAGDLLQAGIDVPALATLADVVRDPAAYRRSGPVFFKSCGWAGWDLAAARLALRR